MPSSVVGTVPACVVAVTVPTPVEIVVADAACVIGVPSAAVATVVAAAEAADTVVRDATISDAFGSPSTST